MEKLKRIYFNLFTVILLISVGLFFFLDPQSDQRMVTIYCIIISSIMLVIIGIMIRKDYKKNLKVKKEKSVKL